MSSILIELIENCSCCIVHYSMHDVRSIARKEALPSFGVYMYIGKLEQHTNTGYHGTVYM